MSLRRAASLLSLLVCAAALVGCGGDTFALDPVASAATKSADSQAGRFEFTAHVNMEGVGAFAFGGSGTFDSRSQSAWMQMVFHAPQLGANPHIQVVLDGSHGLVMYMRSPLFQQLPAGKSWVKMDVEKLAKKAGVDVSAFANANQADPSQTLRMLTASNDAQLVDYQRVRGVLTKHYTLRVDVKRLVRERTELRKLIDALGMSSFPAEAWIDDHDRIRRISMQMSFGGASMTMTEEMYGFGARVNVQPPPASQVVDVSQLIGR